MRNRNCRKALIYGILAVLWIGVLFFFAGQSATDSGALSKKLVQILFRRLIDRGISARTLNHILRKCAHFGIFTVSGFLTGGLFLNLMRKMPAVLITFGLESALAVGNELFEKLADGRWCSVTDMAIDAAGALTGLLLMLLFGALAQSIRRKKERAYNR